MSRLGQFDAGYNRQEDRILLRVTNVEGDEFRLWLTRRLCRSLLTEFKTKTSAYRISTPESVVTTQSDSVLGHATVLQAELEQQATVAQQDFSAEFQPGKNFPLGQQGLVVDEVNLQPHSKGNGVHSLSFRDANGQGITLGVTVEIFNSIFEVVERVVNKSQWDLPVDSSDMPKSMLLQ
ncbi:MAG: hypothetical protein OXE78_06225 [Gammaproteobacteria bacterium]|nr:hypothetical protein [Gammaproteobacteria bacterium]MCY4357964.1 hypothetical protein [Gammaproteobacteria bacterium]